MAQRDVPKKLKIGARPSRPGLSKRARGNSYALILYVSTVQFILSAHEFKVTNKFEFFAPDGGMHVVDAASPQNAEQGLCNGRASVRPSVCRSHRRTSTAASGFVAESWRLQQISIDGCGRRAAGAAALSRKCGQRHMLRADEGGSTSLYI